MKSKAFETAITESDDSLTGPWRATMLLNLASIKDSYAPYQQEYAELYA
jgi:hypothetical protein